MPPAQRQNPNYAIARIDLPGAGTHGFQVRLQRRGIKYGKFFADRVHGVGVSKITVVAPNGNSYQFWQATWSPAPGQRRCVKFSIKRYGDREAFQLAVEARTTGISS